jgi:hypothetical protein
LGTDRSTSNVWGYGLMRKTLQLFAEERRLIAARKITAFFLKNLNLDQVHIQLFKSLLAI